MASKYGYTQDDVKRAVANGISETAFKNRMRRGFTVHEATTIPKGVHKKGLIESGEISPPPVKVEDKRPPIGMYLFYLMFGKWH